MRAPRRDAPRDRAPRRLEERVGDHALGSAGTGTTSSRGYAAEPAEIGAFPLEPALRSCEVCQTVTKIRRRASSSAENRYNRGVFRGRFDTAQLSSRCRSPGCGRRPPSQREPAPPGQVWLKGMRSIKQSVQPTLTNPSRSRIGRDMLSAPTARAGVPRLTASSHRARMSAL